MAQSNPTPTGREPLRANSVQGYLDESLLWGDGTAAPPSRLTQMQQRIWWLSVAGKFFEGLVVFLTGVALPLIAKEYDLTKAQHGIVGAASLFGILIGASALGGLSDRFGRKSMLCSRWDYTPNSARIRRPPLPNGAIRILPNG